MSDKRTDQEIEDARILAEHPELTAQMEEAHA